MTLNVPITLDLTGIEALLGSIGKGSGNTTIQDPIANDVTVAVADPNATTVLDGVQATDAASITVYGRAGRQLVTILANTTEAGKLADYLVRPVPEYWFSSIEVLLNGIPSGNRDAVAELEIGDQIRVSKRFPNVTNPVVQELFVEGIEHDIAVDRHVVRIYCSPASLYRCFVLDVSDLDNDEYGLAGAGAVCSVNSFSTTNADSVTIIDVAGEPYWVADWKASGSVTFDQATEVEYLVVAGGGGGGRRAAGGGGAGGMRVGSVTVGAQAYTVTVGAGGAGAPAGSTVQGSSGGGSSLGSLVSTSGGGGGGSNGVAGIINGVAGGSGGGAVGTGNASSQTGGAGTSGEGNKGGDTPGTGANFTSAGGGGKGAAGANGGNNTGSGTFGDGGAGEASSISGSSLTYAAGGGGGGFGTGRFGLGVSGVSGNGNVGGVGGAGTDGRGGGGGGGGGGALNYAGGKGGDGRVIIRWRVYAN